MVVGLCRGGLAADLYIANPSFELPSMVDGSYVMAINGWVISAATDAGVQNPTDTEFSGTTYPLTGLPDGSQSGWLNTAGSISQTLQATLEANTEYRLTVKVGDRKTTTVGNYSVALYAGSTLLGNASPPTVKDAWITAEVVYRVGSSHEALGQHLRIVFSKPVYVYGQQVNFDTVKLTATSIQVLEPAEHWKLDEASGTQAVGALKGTLCALSTAGAGFDPSGISAGCLGLRQDAGGYGVVDTLTGLGTNGLSVALWARQKAGQPRDGSVLLSLCAKGGTNVYALGLSQPDGPGGAAQAGFGLIGSAADGAHGMVPDDGLWHHVVLVISTNGNATLYVDGVPGIPEAVAAVGGLDLRGGRLAFGGMLSATAAQLPTGRFEGWLDDAQVYAWPLSPRQVSRLQSNPGRRLPEFDATILFTPQPTDFLLALDVGISMSRSGLTLRYTLDGSTPTATSPEYVGVVTVGQTTTVKAVAFDGAVQASEVFSSVYTRGASLEFQPAESFFTNLVSVRIVNKLPFGAILYTLDGSEPTAQSPEYVTPITLVGGKLVKARVFASGIPVSETGSKRYDRVYALDDGIPADWRLRFFGSGYLTDPRVAWDADPDNDGWSNLREYQSGSDPTDAGSAPGVTAGVRAVPLVSWNSLPGANYRVLRKAAVDLPTWEIVSGFLKAVSTNMVFVDTGAPPRAVYLIEMTP